MLKVNQFYWRLYKESPNGMKTIAMFEDAAKASFTPEQAVSLHKHFDPEAYLNVNEETECETYKQVWNELTPLLQTNDTEITPNHIADLMEMDYRDFYQSFLACIAELSFFFYRQNPDRYVPYLFLMRYNYLQQILEDYDIEIEEIPGKASLEQRCTYYFNLCKAFTKFRVMNNMTGPELCAFLYDMERQSYDSDMQEKTKPFPKVWLIGGSKKTEKEAKDAVLYWQANAETKKGDIMVFYETGQTYLKENRSAITGIWTALSDGNSDPLFYYYGMTLIGNEQKIKPIPFKILSGDSRTKKLPRLGANFLGISGDLISTKTYQGLLELIQEWDPSFNVNALPKLSEPFQAKVRFEDRGDMKPEKWVEEYLIKEMLEQMGWGRYEIDYRRQVPLQLGRLKDSGLKAQGGRTDFSLFPFGRKLQCADVLIEAKAPGEMDGKDIEKTFWQAESYASRQYATLLIIADGDKLLLYENKKGYFTYSNDPIVFKWLEIFTDSEKRTQLRDIILKHKKHNHK